MKISVSGIGILDEAEFSLGKMTIICGENNTGKTYATYALFGFLSYWREVFSIEIDEKDITSLLNEGILHLNINTYIDRSEQIIDSCCKAYSNQLSMVFAAQKDRFEGSSFIIKLHKDELKPLENFERRFQSSKSDLFMLSKNKDSHNLTVTLLGEKTNLLVPKEVVRKIIGDALKDIVFSDIFPRPFIASAERTGVAIFRKELNFARNRLLEEMSQADKKVDPFDLLFKVYKDYALPVKKNVEFTRDLESIANQTSYIEKEHPEILNDFADIIGGSYAVSREDQLIFEPKGNKKIKLSMDESSSAVRSLLDIGFYIRHVAKLGDLLIVDEPELNLHPKNQRRIARLFARLVNIGINVFITTHSDYIVKELNTLILLSINTPRLNRLAEREGYRSCEFIIAEGVNVYIAEKSLNYFGNGKRKTWRNTFVKAEVSDDHGIEISSFDATIDDMNRIQDEIVWGDD